MAKIFIFVLFIILIVAISWYFKSEPYIKSEIEKANYCDTKDDCMDAGGKCPFGCYAYVNKNEVGRISNLINSYMLTCMYNCIYCRDVECNNNKCEPICD